MSRHTVCKPGAAVRLHGYAPARVVLLEYERHGPDYSRGRWTADCVITGRGPGWRSGRIGPHGYRTGERVTVDALEAIPRDCIYTARGSGKIVWRGFDIDPEYSARKASTHPTAAALADIDEACQAGLNSGEPSHWEAALQDVLRITRTAQGGAA